MSCSSCGRGPSFLCTGPFRSSNSSRGVSTCPLSSSILALWTAPQAFASWACWMRSTTIVRRSFDEDILMTTRPIKTLFASDIHRRIEEVIKVDQTDEEILREEIDEYVVTDSIQSHYTRIFEAYSETPNKPHEGIAVWVSGFFGSGKSSFAKMLGLSIRSRAVGGIPAGDRFAQRAGDNKLQVLLKAINEKIPTHAVIFDVSTDRGIR